MSIQLDAPGTEYPKYPYAKIPAVGDAVTIHLAEVHEIEHKSFETGEIETFDNGDTKMEKIVSGIVRSVTGTACGRIDGQDVPLTPGDRVTIFTGLSGTYYGWPEGLRNHGTPVNVGDVVTWSTVREEPSQSGGFPRKIREFQFRKPSGDEAAAVTAAEAFHLEQKRTPQLDDADDDQTAPF